MQLWAEKHITGTRHSLKIIGDQKQLVSTMQYFQTSGIFKNVYNLNFHPKILHHLDQLPLGLQGPS